METKGRAKRRTFEAIDKDLIEATEKIVERDGFGRATLSDILHEAAIEPNTFYRRYEDLYDLFDKFVTRNDFFVSFMNVKAFDENVRRESVITLFTDLADELYSNRIMQKTLLWGLSEVNETTRNITAKREEVSVESLEVYNKLFPGNSPVDISTFIALIIGGIYYLILHKDKGLFCGIDFSRKTGKKQLEDTIRTITLSVLAYVEESEKTFEIARKLKTEGIGEDIIARATGLSIEMIEGL